MGVVKVKDQAAAFRLVLQDPALGVDVILKIPVLIQMIGREVGNHRHIRAAVHAVQLEGAELQNRCVLWQNLRDLAQERMADVPAQMDAIPCRLQQLCDDGGGGGLPVAAGNGNHLAGTELEKHLHLGGDQTAPLLCRLQMRIKGHQSRRAEQDILVQMLQIIRSQLQLGAHGLQALGLAFHLAAGAHVAGRHITAAGEQQLEQREIADADADDRDPLGPDALHIFQKSQIQHLLSQS